MGISIENFLAMEKRLNAARGKSHGKKTQVHGPLPNTRTKRLKAGALGSSTAREKKIVGRTLVSFTGYRVRPLDPDAFAGSVKDLLDGLRHAGLVPDDNPWEIRLVTDQVKVHHFNEEKIEIEITYEDENV